MQETSVILSKYFKSWISKYIFETFFNTYSFLKCTRVLLLIYR